jgi:hypothetical protein
MRKRPSYANVTATIALFVALGGGAYAALDLPKNSVTTKEIKNKTIKKKDLAKNSVAKKQLRANAVNGSKVAPDSLRGNDIDESSLGIVPSAANSERVGGNRIQQIQYSAGPGTPAQQLFSLGGLTVTAECQGAGDDFVLMAATTDTNDSVISLPNTVWAGGNEGEVTAGTDNDFDSGEVLEVPIDDTTATMVYGRGGGSSPVVSASFLANQFVGGGGTCEVVGTVMTDG